MVNYNNSLIYKLCCKDTNIKDIYIGSTTDFTKRKHDHKFRCNNEKSKRYNAKNYQFIRDNGGWENWDMVLIEKVICNDKLELHKKEREYIEKLNSTLNSVNSIQSPTERKEYIINYQKTEKRKEYMKKYRKEYREKNREKLKQKDKEYYENNKLKNI